MTTIGGRYTLLERIGSGAMGVVWRARDEVLTREVAVKQLVTPDHQRAMREARNAARLQHPHAIAVFDVVSHDDHPWLVMEYLASRSLSAVIAQDGPLAPDEAARIGGHVASALAAAHSAGIVHRDIKPGNVLIGHDGTVKITDFGISRATGDGTLTETGMIPGTPAFLAPEVARGEPPNPSADIFSLGATLFAAVEGDSPYGPSENSFGHLYRAASGQVQAPKKAGGLTGPLQRMLTIEPTARPTAAEMAALLTPVSQPLPVPARGKRPRRRTVLVLAIVALLALLGTAAPALWPEPSGTPAEASFPQVTYFTAEEARGFVRAHYAALPGDARQAWQNLAGKATEPVEAYEARWKAYTTVDCQPVEVFGRGPNWVVKTHLQLTRQGVPEQGVYEIEVAAVGDQMKIVSSARVG